MVVALVAPAGGGLLVAREQLRGYHALDLGTGRFGAFVPGSEPQRTREAGEYSELTVSCRPGTRFLILFALVNGDGNARTVRLTRFHLHPNATRGLAVTSIRPTNPSDGTIAGAFKPQRFEPDESHEYRLDGTIRSCATRSIESVDADTTSAVLDEVEARVRVGWVEHDQTIRLKNFIRVLG